MQSPFPFHLVYRGVLIALGQQWCCCWIYWCACESFQGVCVIQYHFWRCGMVQGHIAMHRRILIVIVRGKFTSVLGWDILHSCTAGYNKITSRHMLQERRQKQHGQLFSWICSPINMSGMKLNDWHLHHLHKQPVTLAELRQALVRVRHVSMQMANTLSIEFVNWILIPRGCSPWMCNFKHHTT